MPTCSRRTFLKAGAGSLLAVGLGAPLPRAAAAETTPGKPFRLNYLLASSLYGNVHLREVVPEVAKAGLDALDVWCPAWVPHRTQLDELGHDAFLALLKRHKTRLGSISPYNLGPFGLKDELRVIAKLGGTLAICGSTGPAADVKAATKDFVEKLKPQVAVAEEVGVTIGIENHGGALLSSPDSIRCFCETATSDRLGVVLAPYHLPQDPAVLAGLIKDMGPKLAHLYAWQLPAKAKEGEKPDDLPELPGHGGMDFTPIVAALKAIGFKGWTEIFTHAHKHNGAMAATTDAVTQEVVRCRQYLEACLAKA